MKPLYKQKTFWVAIIGYATVIGFVILNKALGLGFTVAETATILSSITILATGFIGAEKLKDSRIIAKKIELEALKYGQPLAEAFNIIASKSPEGRKLVEKFKTIIENTENIKEELSK